MENEDNINICQNGGKYVCLDNSNIEETESSTEDTVIYLDSFKVRNFFNPDNYWLFGGSLILLLILELYYCNSKDTKFVSILHFLTGMTFLSIFFTSLLHNYPDILSTPKYFPAVKSNLDTQDCYCSCPDGFTGQYCEIPPIPNIKIYYKNSLWTNAFIHYDKNITGIFTSVPGEQMSKTTLDIDNNTQNVFFKNIEDADKLQFVFNNGNNIWDNNISKDYFILEKGSYYIDSENNTIRKIDNSCSPECLNNGECVNGICQCIGNFDGERCGKCKQGWEGVDCMIKECECPECGDNQICVKETELANIPYNRILN